MAVYKSCSSPLRGLPALTVLHHQVQTNALTGANLRDPLSYHEILHRRSIAVAVHYGAVFEKTLSYFVWTSTNHADADGALSSPVGCHESLHVRPAVCVRHCVR